MADADRQRLVATVTSRLGLPATVDALSLVCALAEKASVVEGLHADDPDFDLLSVIPARARDRAAKILVNWYRFDEIYRIELGELSEFFTDFWYPSADDLDIFDDDFSWVVSVTHHGAVKRLDFGDSYGA